MSPERNQEDQVVISSENSTPTSQVIEIKSVLSLKKCPNPFSLFPNFFSEKKEEATLPLFGAEGGTRTPTGIHPLDPEARQMVTSRNQQERGGGCKINHL